jgi:hypothetical protein
MKTREIIETKKITEEISQKHINQTFWISSRTIFFFISIRGFFKLLIKKCQIFLEFILSIIINLKLKPSQLL